MKKILMFFMLAGMMVFTACTKDPEPVNKPEEENQAVTPSDNSVDKARYHTIVDLWQITMRREIPYPFKVYLIKLADGKWFYLRRLNFDGELHCGDEINFSYYNSVPDEIAVIHGLIRHNGTDARENAMHPGIGTYLVASDPIEADVKNMFELKMRYALPFTPIETVVIETTDSNIIYVKKSKLGETDSADLKIGDHFAYNVYTIFPNEVLAIKKMNKNTD